MTETEQIKHDFFQLCYSKQRVLIDEGKLDYWRLSEKNRRGIVDQCKKEAEKYPELRWQARLHNGINCGDSEGTPPWAFSSINLFYRRLDPLPIEEESEEVAELKKQIASQEEEIKLLEGNLEWNQTELQKQEEISQNQIEQIKRLQQVAEYDNQDAERQANLIANYRLEEASLYRDIRKLAMHIAN